MVSVPITLIIVVIGSVQFIGWIAPSHVYTGIVLDGSINKLKCSMFHIKRAVNRVPVCMITYIIEMKYNVWF